MPLYLPTKLYSQGLYLCDLDTQVYSEQADGAFFLRHLLSLFGIITLLGGHYE